MNPHVPEQGSRGLVSSAKFRRRAVKLLGLPFDEVGANPPARWWELMDRVLVDIESKGEPVEAVGQILLG
jgi:hypothetical protein